jgi:hypothetical protein
MIDRKQVVGRHHPFIKGFQPLSPMSVGNGHFAFTTDVTGLQSFPNRYEVPLGTQAYWAWHSTEKHDLYTLEDVDMQAYDTHGRPVYYPLFPEGKPEAYHWLRQNPHRLQLGQLGFKLMKKDGTEAEAENLVSSEQVLDLWEGTLHSEFVFEGHHVKVMTVCHAYTDQIGVKVSSSLLAEGRLQVRLRFPSGDMTSTDWAESIGLNWAGEERHQSVLLSSSSSTGLFERVLDEDRYYVRWSWDEGELEQTGKHQWELTPSIGAEKLEFSVGFAETVPETESFASILASSGERWPRFWSTGGCIDFSECTDPRAHELERRVVLSQFLTALHSTGPMPPQETGLVYNSWFGKSHLEMHWWHGSHFPLWGRSELLVESMDWYLSILPLAQELAASQGYEGARWPKMIGPDGKQSPSPIAPALIWQQPHPIILAELCYLADPKQETLRRWVDIIKGSADFMVSFAVWDEEKQAYVLGPPLIPAQENHKPEEAVNPPYELEYWKHGLDVAALWMERMGQEVPARWLEVAGAMAEPAHAEGVYLAHEHCPDTFTEFNHDHPSMVAAYGILPGTLIDPAVMKATLERVKKDWLWDTAWGWDFPMCAMTAARLGDGDLAVDFLMMAATKNSYLPNGHNYQREDLMLYLPGNGGLLSAVSMMACGWQKGPHGGAPGFPKDGRWKMKWEGLMPLL